MLCICTCTCTYIHVGRYIHAYTHTHNICTYIDLSTSELSLEPTVVDPAAKRDVYSYTHTHTHTHTYTHPYTHTYIHTCTYIHAYILNLELTVVDPAAKHLFAVHIRVVFSAESTASASADVLAAAYDSASLSQKGLPGIDPWLSDLFLVLFRCVSGQEGGVNTKIPNEPGPVSV